MTRNLLLALVLSSATATAQAPITPAQACRNVGNAYQTAAAQAARDSGKTPDPSTIGAESRRLTRACADTLSATRGSITDLSALSSLWLSLGDTVKAERIVADLG